MSPPAEPGVYLFDYYLSGIVTFYRNVCQWDETRFQIPPRPRVKKLPMIFSKEEVKRLFDSADNLKHRVLLKTVYSAGLRVGEVVRLKPDHIESDPSRMVIRVEQGKGKKDRYTVLSRKLLPELRDYWRQYRPGKWLFPGQKAENHMRESAAQSAFYKAKKKPGSPKVGAFIPFATHRIYQGTDIYTINRRLGHSSIKSTLIYLHLIPERITNLQSPLDCLDEE